MMNDELFKWFAAARRATGEAPCTSGESGAAHAVLKLNAPKLVQDLINQILDLQFSLSEKQKECDRFNRQLGMCRRMLKTEDWNKVNSSD